MKYRNPVLVIIAGVIFILLGAWMKITHMSQADTFLGIGFITKIIGLIYLGIVVARKNPS